MPFRKFYSMFVLVTVAAMNVLALPAVGQVAECGPHTVDDLFEDSLTENSAMVGQHVAHLQSGFVYGQPIPDARTGMSLYRVDNEIGLIFGGGTMAGGMEFEIDLLPNNDFQAFRDAGMPLDVADFAFVQGCNKTSAIPQYVGTGMILTPDGKSIPATIQLVMWIGQDDVNDTAAKLNLYGFVQSTILNGNVFVF